MKKGATITFILVIVGICALSIGIGLLVWYIRGDTTGGTDPITGPGPGSGSSLGPGSGSGPSPGPSPSPSPGPGPSSSSSNNRGRKILNTRKIRGAPADPTGQGRFYTACYGPDDGYGGKGAYSNALNPGPLITSIALPRGRTDGQDVSNPTRATFQTTDFNHPLVAKGLGSKWTHEEEYAFMKDEKNRPRYLMVGEDGSELCVRVDDKCEGCYWGDRGIGGTGGFDIDVYTEYPDATCYKHRPNQWVEIYESDKC
jgi:hypothetical protein